jgi:DNA primase
MPCGYTINSCFPGRAPLDWNIKGAGLTDRTIEEFNLGFAPDTWNFLTGKLRQKRASMELAEEMQPGGARRMSIIMTGFAKG